MYLFLALNSSYMMQSMKKRNSYPELAFQFDMKNHRQFLRRTKTDDVRPEDLYIGSSVNVLSRQLTFVDYGDCFTEKRLGHKTQRWVLCVFWIRNATVVAITGTTILVPYLLSQVTVTHLKIAVSA